MSLPSPVATEIADGDKLTHSDALDSGNNKIGSVVIDSSGQFVFSPDPGFTGTAHFTYTLTDAQDAASTGTVTINVAAPQPATFGQAPSFTVEPSGPTTIAAPGLLGNGDLQPERADARPRRAHPALGRDGHARP